MKLRHDPDPNLSLFSGNVKMTENEASNNLKNNSFNFIVDGEKIDRKKENCLTSNLSDLPNLFCSKLLKTAF